jgi:hypothetical protein
MFKLCTKARAEAALELCDVFGTEIEISRNAKVEAQG